MDIKVHGTVCACGPPWTRHGLHARDTPEGDLLDDNGFPLSEERFVQNKDEELAALAETLAGVNPCDWLRLLLGAEGTQE